MPHSDLQTMIITGASGFVGRHLVEACKDNYKIYAFARRSQQEVGVERHANVKWILVDIADTERLAEVFQEIRKEGGADYLVHLAAYFDFGNEPNVAYERTNVQGTRNILEESHSLLVKRFIFASSIVVTVFPQKGEILNERSPADADFPYAVTKAACEQMIMEYSNKFPCSIVRFAAIFSDWCEYGPLYKFMDTWFGEGYMARILGGRGKSAVPYIHINSLIDLLLKIIEKTDELPELDTYIASPDRATNHEELFNLATRLHYGEARVPFHMPKFMARIGVYARDWIGRAIGRRPFERPWMMQYIDKRMDVDASYTRMALDWDIKPRYLLTRRLLYMVEHLKTYPVEWHTRNALAMVKTPDRPDLKIADALSRIHEDVVSRVHGFILLPAHADRFPHYQEMEPDKLKWYLGMVYNQLRTAVRTGDRLSMANYARFIASIRIREGFTFEEVKAVFDTYADIITGELLWDEELKDLESRIHDDISLTIQMAIDEIEDAFENADIPGAYQRFEAQ